MKLFKKNDKLSYSRIIHRELSEEIASTDAKLLLKHKQTAQRTSTMDFGKLKKGTKIKDLLGSMRPDFQRLIEKIDQILAGALSIFQSAKDISNAKGVIADYARKIQDATDTLATLKGRINEASEKLVAKVRMWTHRMLWVLYFLAGFELIANYGVYQLLGGGALSAVAISVLSALVIFWWGHLTPKYVIMFGGDSVKRQLLVFILLATPIFIMFYLFSEMRISALIVSNPEMREVFVSSPIVPTLINFFGYLIACYLVFVYRPTKEELEAYKKYRLDTQEIQKLSNLRGGLITERNAQVPALQTKLSDHYNFLLLAGQLEREVQTRYEGCFEEFKSELYLRTNSKCDPIFTGDIKQDLPPLDLKYQNIDKTQFELCEDLY